MAVKVLMPGAFFSFGQYRGKEVEEILQSNPSYIYWCYISGTARLVPELIDAMKEWAAENPKEARRVEGSVQKDPRLVARFKAVMEEMKTIEIDRISQDSEFAPRVLQTEDVLESWGEW